MLFSRNTLRFALPVFITTGLAIGQTNSPEVTPSDLPSPKPLEGEEPTAPSGVTELGTKPEARVDFETRINDAITRGVDFLIAKQNPSGSWGSATKTKGLNINAPIPGAHHAFRMGSSALALEGLLMSNDRRPETKKAIEKAENWMLATLPRLRRAEQSTIYNNWGHCYSLRALVELHRYHEGNASKQATLARAAEEQIKMLYRYEYLNGGWGYYDFVAHTQKPSGTPTSFTTASVLTALKDASDTFKIPLSERVVKRALRCLAQQETPDGAFVYSLPHWRVPRKGINRPAGSLARSQACNVALRAYGNEAITDERLHEWLDRLTKRDGFLALARKRPIPHETHFSISGYFYYYGHYYASEAFSLLPEDVQPEIREKLAHILLEKQEKNGSWWDYPLYDYHSSYGTGYTLTALSRYCPTRKGK